MIFGAVAVAAVAAIVLLPKNDQRGPATAAAPSEDHSVPEPWLQDITKQYAGPSLNLKDPDSAKYTDTTYRTRHGVPFVCGFVNAKNSFGAYTGPRAFIIGGGTTLVEGSSRFKRAWQKECVQTDASEASSGAATNSPPGN